MSTLPISKQAIIDTLIFVTVSLPLFLFHALGKPTVTGFWCRDQSLSYPYKPDTVSTSVLLVSIYGGPFFVMTVVETIQAAMKSRTFRQFRAEVMSLVKSYGIFLFGMAITCIITDVLKYSVGRLRPHFFDICRPDFDKINCTTAAGIPRYIDQYECTNTLADSKLLRDNYLSFPSGHASLSIFASLFTIFFLQLRMEVSFSHLLRPTLQMLLMVLAMFCCVTRITDNKHFLSDVLAGCAIGASIAWLSFYKLAYDIIRNQPTQKSPRLPRATSIESEPQTPTPLLRPDRLVISHSYRNNSGPGSKDDLVHQI